MKKVMFALAIAGMFSFAACGNKNAEEENVDTIDSIQTETVETPVDTAAPVDSTATPAQN